MLGFFKKQEVISININEAYRHFDSEPQNVILLCVDEQKTYDETHIRGAECLPLRLLEKEMDYFYPNKELTYYVYAINPANAKLAYKKLIKQGYNVISAGSLLDYRGREEGSAVSRKNKRRRK